MSLTPERGGQAEAATPASPPPQMQSNAAGRGSVTPTTAPPDATVSRSPPLQWDSPSSRGGGHASKHSAAAAAVGRPRKDSPHLSSGDGFSTATGSCSVHEVPTLLVTPKNVDSVVSEEAAVPGLSDMGPGNVCVIVRVRPMISNKMAQPCCRVIDGPGMVEYTAPLRELPVLGNTFQTTSATPTASLESRRTYFAYDAALGEAADQNDTMKCVGYKMLRYLLQGYNATILCYGQSGSGKTHSMIGPAGGMLERLQKPEDFGLVPRMLESLFTLLQQKFPVEPEQEQLPHALALDAMEEEEEEEEEEGSEVPPKPGWHVEIGALELYQEEMRDVLADGPPLNSSSRAASVSSPCNSVTPRSVRSLRSVRSVPPAACELKICEDPDWGVAVSGLSWFPVRSFDVAMQTLLRATRTRRIGATSLNERSSRSHFFVFVALQQWGVEEAEGAAEQRGAEEEEERTRRSSGGRTRSLLTLVDLAGSERVSATGAEGLRLKEAQTINLSLTLLGNVIRKLTATGKEREQFTHIPYRDSKLTRLLQESIGGNAFTTLLCTVSPETRDAAESLSTLQFAKRAKRIRNRPVVNHLDTKEELKSKLQLALRRIVWLEKQLAALVKVRRRSDTTEMDKAEDAGAGALLNHRTGNPTSDELPAGGEVGNVTPCVTLSPIIYDLPGIPEENGGGIHYIPKKELAHKLLEELGRNEVEAAHAQRELAMYARLLQEEREDRERVEGLLFEERHRRLEVESQLHSISPPRGSSTTPSDGACFQSYADTPDWFAAGPSAGTRGSRERDASSRTLWRRSVANSPWQQPLRFPSILRALSACVPFMQPRKDASLERNDPHTGGSPSRSDTRAPGSIYSGIRSAAVRRDDDDDDDEDGGDRPDAEEVASLDSPCNSTTDTLSMVRQLVQYGVRDMLQP
ncbi:putative MCAK-like kinesin [Trypanosoma conorhini]|uniref:Putative MCAK-like kinesin n=1 Tax=Trypanosoma conorhini TaxID=83891 RepID=A0A3R7L4P6_9TRYP|nr:putative MCAK-like kinesin [Trypanosoma conorhini]RNF16137.1 putative MCAK-like kinesin [Trypanosoma conorhini]